MPLPLYQWGAIQFLVYPVNVNEVDHITATDWARKEIAGAAIHREWVGEGDEEIHLRGKLYPHFFAMHRASSQSLSGPSSSAPETRDASGMNTMDLMNNMRRLGQAHMLIRGDGTKFGWFVLERLSRGHSYLGMEGIGQQIAFEATFQRVPVPEDPGLYVTTLFGQGAA